MIYFKYIKAHECDGYCMCNECGTNIKELSKNMSTVIPIPNLNSTPTFFLNHQVQTRDSRELSLVSQYTCFKKVPVNIALHLMVAKKESNDKAEFNGSWKEIIGQLCKVFLSQSIEMSPLLFAQGSVLTGGRN